MQLNVSPGLKHAVLLAMLFLVSSVVLTLDTNVEFYGDDYWHGRELIIYGNPDLIPNFDGDLGSTARKWLDSVLNSYLFRGAHGPVPAIYLGPVYRIIDALGIPVNKFVLQIPLYLICISGVVLMYLYLFRCGMGFAFSFLGAMLLLISPVYVFCARGFASFWYPILALDHLACLLALSYLSEKRISKIFTGIAFLHLAGSDILFFLSIPAIVVAYILKDCTSWRDVRLILKNLAKSPPLKLLKAKVIWLPTTLYVLLMIFAETMQSLGVIGVYTQLNRAFGHSSETSGGTFRLLNIFKGFSWLSGEAALAVLCIAIAVFFFFRKSILQRGTIVKYSLLAGCGFFALFYLIIEYSISIAAAYQIYLLVPVVLFIVVCLKELSEHSKKARLLAYTLVLAQLSISASDTYAVIWNRPEFTLTSMEYMSLYGTVNENTGTKGIGYLMRNILKKNAGRDQLILSSSIINESLLMYGGLQQDGKMVKQLYNIPRVDIIGKQGPFANLANKPLADASGAYYKIVMDFRSENSNEAAVDCTYYYIKHNSRWLAVIAVIGEQLDSGTNNIFELNPLEKLFDQTYNSVNDYFYYF